jgi:hypothetical protein
MPVNFRHEAIIDLMIAAPKMTKGEIALYLGYTQAWISTLISSDAFQMRLAERRNAIATELDAAAIQRLHDLDKAAGDIIAKELENEDCDPHFALNVKKTVQQNMPNGKNKNLDSFDANMLLIQRNTQINIGVLEKARNKMRGIETKRLPNLDDDPLVAEVTR